MNFLMDVNGWKNIYNMTFDTLPDTFIEKRIYENSSF